MVAESSETAADFYRSLMHTLTEAGVPFLSGGAFALLGMQARICPIEEMIWSKAFIMERERCDEADVMHLLRARAESLDWARLLARFGPHWRLLLSQLLLFGFVYPAERDRVPAWVLAAWVLDELLARLRAELHDKPQAPDAPDQPTRLCQGTLLSRAQYLVDIQRWGYEDARLHLPRPMTPEEIARWTEGIARDGG